MGKVIPLRPGVLRRLAEIEDELLANFRMTHQSRMWLTPQGVMLSAVVQNPNHWHAAPPNHLTLVK